MKNKWFIFFFYTVINAQVDGPFVRHLIQNDLQKEFEAYILKLPFSDSLAYYKATYYLNREHDSLFILNYNNSRDLSVKDPALVRKADLFFLKNSNDKLRIQWFEQHKPNNDISEIYLAAENPVLFKKHQFPDALQGSFHKYQLSVKKKAAIGGFISILPGAGKLYAGKPRSALIAFVINAAYAIQTIESAKKLGTYHPLTLINFSVFSVFYLSNIYGGYHSVKEIKKENKKQFISDAAAFYN